MVASHIFNLCKSSQRDRSCYNNFEFQRKLLFIAMPPVRRKSAKGISNRNNRSRSTAANSDTESLRRQYTERGLPNHGQKNALIFWLQQHATTSSSRPKVDAAGNANLPSTSTFP